MSHLFLGNLRYDVARKDIEALFMPYGRLLDVTLKRSFGFVELSNTKNARKAIRDLNGLRFKGDRLLIEFARDHQVSGESEKRYRVMVENLNYDVSWQELKDFMRRGGEILHADVNGDGQGIADFATPMDAHMAVITLAGENLRGRPLAVREMDPSRDLDWNKYRKFVSSRDHTRFHPSRDYPRPGWSLGSDSYHDRRQDRRRSRSRSRSPRRRSHQDDHRGERTWDRKRSNSRSLERRSRKDRPSRQRSDSSSPARAPRTNDEAGCGDRRGRSSSRD